MTIYEYISQNRRNSNKRFGYYIIDNKRIGRAYFKRNILANKGGRLCANKISTAAQFNKYRNNIVYHINT